MAWRRPARQETKQEFWERLASQRREDEAAEELERPARQARLAAHAINFVPYSAEDWARLRAQRIADLGYATGLSDFVDAGQSGPLCEEARPDRIDEKK